VFVYDSQSRRVSKTVSNWVSSAWAFSTNVLFAYDGWNLLGIVDSSGALVQSFMWGLDLSGSMQGAGGVGGLIAFSASQSTPGTHFAAFDGNGNLLALVDGKTGSTSARYEYGPFGEVIRSSGTMASANPLRFSTKFQDDETGWLYYGYRFYDASTGRWPSRDPYGPDSDITSLSFVGNAPLTSIDLFGLYTIPVNVVYDVDASKFPGGEDARFYLLPGGAIIPGNVVDCVCGTGCPGQKLDGYQITIQGTIEWKKDVPKTAVVASGKSLLSHELGHARNEELWINGQEALLKKLSTSCFKIPCFRAWVAYMLNYISPYDRARVRYMDAALDCNDYGGDCAKKPDLYTTMNSLYIEAQNALKLVNAACNAPGK
jgi:RHS repeat-associated protein